MLVVLDNHRIYRLLGIPPSLPPKTHTLGGPFAKMNTLNACLKTQNKNGVSRNDIVRKRHALFSQEQPRSSPSPNTLPSYPAEAQPVDITRYSPGRVRPQMRIPIELRTQVYLKTLASAVYDTYPKAVCQNS